MVQALRASPRAARPAFYLAVRAHHADVGGLHPGSMAPVDSILDEGLRLAPQLWATPAGVVPALVGRFTGAVRQPEERVADLRAQQAGLASGAARLQAHASRRGGLEALARDASVLVGYAARQTAHALLALPDAQAHVSVGLDAGDRDGIPARVVLNLTKRGDMLHADFAGTTGPVGQGLNAPRAVTESAVYYLLACLVPPGTPKNEGLLEHARLTVPAGSLLDAAFPQPVAGGNVETSQRVVDALCLAAASCWPDHIPAPGAGTMSNWAFGPVPDGATFPVYYETLPGGGGGGPVRPGAHAVQQHMTNTRSTPVEVMEARWPVRVVRMARRRGSGGAGRHAGGDGLLRELEFLTPAEASFLMTRHALAPPGVAGGGAGATGCITLRRRGRASVLPPRSTCRLEPGDQLVIETPGGGGWGAPVPEGSASAPSE